MFNQEEITIAQIKDLRLVYIHNCEETLNDLKQDVKILEEENEDLYAAIDLVSDKLERQIRKNKTKINSKIDEKTFTGLMMNTGELVTDVGSVLNGEKAVKEGLIDELGNLSDVIECLNNMIENKG